MFTLVWYAIVHSEMFKSKDRDYLSLSASHHKYIIGLLAQHEWFTHFKRDARRQEHESLVPKARHCFMNDHLNSVACQISCIDNLQV